MRADEFTRLTLENWSRNTDEIQRGSGGVRKVVFALWMLHILCFPKPPSERVWTETVVALHKH